MSKEAKIAIVTGTFVLVLAGWFYFGRTPTGGDVALSGSGESSAPQGAEATTAEASRPLARTEPVPGMVSWTKPRSSVAAPPDPPPSVAHRAEPAPVDDSPVHQPSSAVDAESLAAAAERSSADGGPKPVALDEILAGQTVSPEADLADDDAEGARTEPIAAVSSAPPPSDGTLGPSAAPTRTYTVVRGDTLALISELHYNSQRYADLLAAANPQITNKQLIRTGMVLNVPPLDELTKLAGTLATTTATPADGLTRAGPDASSTLADAPAQSFDVYTVKLGDTLYSISTRLLGAGNRWREILELNNDLLGGQPANLRPNQVLKLPPRVAAAR